MSDVRVAVLSDIHGNRWALEAVLADIRRRGIEQIVNLGDSLYGPLDPAGTATTLLPLNLPTVRGNEDRIVVDAPSQRADSPTLRFVRESLTADHVRWLNTLEPTMTAYGHFRLCHGSLDRDDEYLLQEVTPRGVALRRPETLAARLTSFREPVLLCGHDHIPRTVLTPGGKLIVNPGSVGLPAYTDDVPVPHVMETGTPHARYAVITSSPPGWIVEDVAIPYDWESAAREAESHGRPDWAAWLRTGRAAAALTTHSFPSCRPWKPQA